MKKLLISLTILAVAAAAALDAVADDAVYSANTVAVIKYEIPPNGQLACVSLPINPMNDTGDWVFGDTEFAKQLPDESTVYFWNGYGWQGADKDAWDGWPEQILTTPIPQGAGLFIQQPAGAPAKEIAIVGELPDDASVTHKIRGGGNLDLTSATFYPVDVVFGETKLAQELPDESTVYFWNGYGWQGADKDAWDGWPETIAASEIKIGQAIFVQGKTAKDIVETCPYDLN